MEIILGAVCFLIVVDSDFKKGKTKYLPLKKMYIKLN